MKLLFFAPHAAIWAHAFPEALIAEALRDSGHEIFYATCGRQLKAGCVAMAAYGVSSQDSPERRAEVCRRCEDKKHLLRHEFGFRGSDIAEELSPEDISAITSLIAKVRRDTVLDLEVFGVNVGRTALYEFLLAHKKSAVEFENDGVWHDYLASLENTLYAAYAARRIIQREVPDAIVVYNALYSVNQTVCRLAALHNHPSYFLHAGGNLAHRLQTMMVSKGDIFDLMRQAIDMWPRHRNSPVDADTAGLVTDHFLELLRGHSVFTYSSPQTGGAADPRKRFGIGPQQKVLCATLSSYDERFAAEAIGVRPVVSNIPFPTQADWVKSLIEYVALRPSLFLVIRVHPREFPNKREGVKSAHASQLEALFADMPSNVAVNWPADDLSLYDLAEVTDVFLNAWSSVGKEMSLLGIPVVSYSSELALYPVDMNYLGLTPAAYFDAIERAIGDGWRFENIIRIYRWCATEYRRMVIDVSDAVHSREYATSSLLSRAFGKLVRTFDPYRNERRDCRARPRPIESKDRIAALFASGASSALDTADVTAPATTSVEAEGIAIRSQMGRILSAMYPGEKARLSRLGRWLTCITESSSHA